MRVSLIVTTYNWPAALDVTLASVALQTRMPSEVIVADDGSGPETENVVRGWTVRMPCPVHHVWQEDTGFRLARSRNRAIAHATGEYIVLIDGDMVLHPKFVTDRLAGRPEQSFQLIWPYTDLLLHDMGEELADDRPEVRASGREWRTPPLWGIGLTELVTGRQSFLHDGRARTLLEAVLWHGGEARASRDTVARLPKAERDALIRFLESL